MTRATSTSCASTVAAGAFARGRHIPLRTLSEGMPVRASFDLVGGGESLARDIEVQR